MARSRSPEPHPPRPNNECRLFVGNLSFETRENDLGGLLEKMGPLVSCEIFTDYDGRSKGRAVVEFKYPEDARAAVREFNEINFMGRNIYVREDRQPADRMAPPQRRYDREGEFRLFVGNLPFSTSWQDLKDIFRKAGHVIRADIKKNFDGRSKGCGIVAFESKRDAERAIDMFDRIEIQGRRIEVREDRYDNRDRREPPRDRYREQYRREDYPPDNRDYHRRDHHDYRRDEGHDFPPPETRRMDDYPDRYQEPRGRSRSRSPVPREFVPGPPGPNMEEQWI